MQKIFPRILRLAIYTILKKKTSLHWQWLRYYPHVKPTNTLLKSWQTSEWPEYQQWIDQNAVCSLEKWLEFQRQAVRWKNFPRISIVVPVYNTTPEMLSDCILSVRIQTSPFWELILADDGSTKPETCKILKSRLCHDPRIRLLKADTKNSTGISATTNRGIDKASGDYIIFLDHDDRLAPEAVQSVAMEIINNRSVDIIYTDRDMISVNGKRYMHLMKPDWSPENLYSGNYIFHLMCYSKKILQKVNNLRPEYNGSQDYDLILRCMEHKPEIKHIPQVLYHWRQHELSVAMSDEVKSYAFEAGKRALADALTRRKVQAYITEDSTLPRGVYQVHLPPVKSEEIDLITLENNSAHKHYRKTLLAHRRLQHGNRPYILIKCNGYSHKKYCFENLASWLKMEAIGMVSGRVLNTTTKEIIYAGMTYSEDGELLIPYKGYSADEAGYMAVTKIIRNISAPDPFCVAIRRELWEELDGFDSQYSGPHALLDLALRALHKDWRIIYNPQVTFTCKKSPLASPFPNQDEEHFVKQWQHWLIKGDPYYSPNIARNCNNYELNHTV